MSGYQPAALSFFARAGRLATESTKLATERVRLSGGLTEIRFGFPVAN